MLDIAQMPLAKRMWRLSKYFRIPLNDIRIQNLDIFDIEFYEYSMIAEDPKKLEQLQNHFYDPEFDEWLEEFERENPQEQSIETNEDLQRETNKDMSQESFEDYDISEETTEISDWERVKE